MAGACSCDPARSGLIGLFPCGEPGCIWHVPLTPAQRAEGIADWYRSHGLTPPGSNPRA